MGSSRASLPCLSRIITVCPSEPPNTAHSGRHLSGLQHQQSTKSCSARDRPTYCNFLSRKTSQPRVSPRAGSTPSSWSKKIENTIGWWFIHQMPRISAGQSDPLTPLPGAQPQLRQHGHFPHLAVEWPQMQVGCKLSISEPLPRCDGSTGPSELTLPSQPQAVVTMTSVSKMFPDSVVLTKLLTVLISPRGPLHILAAGWGL